MPKNHGQFLYVVSYSQKIKQNKNKKRSFTQIDHIIKEPRKLTFQLLEPALERGQVRSLFH